VPIVEHFALVLGWKSNHSFGVGICAVNNQVAEERIRLQAHIEASEQHEATAWACADAAKQHAEAAGQRAQALEGQVLTVVETNAQLQEEQQSQLYELSSLRQIQTWENNLINKWLNSMDSFILVLRSLHHIGVQYL